MITAKQKQAIRDSVSADRISFRKDGTVQFKRSYFYRMGDTAETFADRVCEQINKAGFIPRGIEAEDKWAAWPKTSYFVVTCAIAPIEVAVA